MPIQTAPKEDIRVSSQLGNGLAVFIESNTGEAWVKDNQGIAAPLTAYLPPSGSSIIEVTLTEAQGLEDSGTWVDGQWYRITNGGNDLPNAMLSFTAQALKINAGGVSLNRVGTMAINPATANSLVGTIVSLFACFDFVNVAIMWASDQYDNYVEGAAVSTFPWNNNNFTNNRLYQTCVFNPTQLGNGFHRNTLVNSQVTNYTAGSSIFENSLTNSTLDLTGLLGTVSQNTLIGSTITIGNNVGNASFTGNLFKDSALTFDGNGAAIGTVQNNQFIACESVAAIVLDAAAGLGYNTFNLVTFTALNLASGSGITNSQFIANTQLDISGNSGAIVIQNTSVVSSFIEAHNCTNATITNCTIENNAQIIHESNTGNVIIGTSTINNSTISTSSSAGISFDSCTLLNQSSVVATNSTGFDNDIAYCTLDKATIAFAGNCFNTIWTNNQIANSTLNITAFAGSFTNNVIANMLTFDISNCTSSSGFIYNNFASGSIVNVSDTNVSVQACSLTNNSTLQLQNTGPFEVILQEVTFNNVSLLQLINVVFEVNALALQQVLMDGSTIGLSGNQNFTGGGGIADCSFINSTFQLGPESALLGPIANSNWTNSSWEITGGSINGINHCGFNNDSWALGGGGGNGGGITLSYVQSQSTFHTFSTDNTYEFLSCNFINTTLDWSGMDSTKVSAGQFSVSNVSAIAFGVNTPLTLTGTVTDTTSTVQVSLNTAGGVTSLNLTEFAQYVGKFLCSGDGVATIITLTGLVNNRIYSFYADGSDTKFGTGGNIQFPTLPTIPSPVVTITSGNPAESITGYKQTAGDFILTSCVLF